MCKIFGKFTKESFWHFWWEIMTNIFICYFFWCLLDNLSLLIGNIKLLIFGNRNIIFRWDGLPIILWKLIHTRLIVTKWKRTPRKLLVLLIIYLLIRFFLNVTFLTNFLTFKLIGGFFFGRLLNLIQKSILTLFFLRNNFCRYHSFYK